MNWYDKAEEQLSDDLTNGHITQKEYNLAIRELQQEYREAAEDAAQQAYNEYY